ncbi:MAG: hypothetical protein PHF52_05505 [Sulfurospirillaceae bacterium]|nr:hypothetical protein [Sulfurospirillaceae bacterium]
MFSLLKKIYNACCKSFVLSDPEKEFIKLNKEIWSQTSGPIGVLIEGFLYSPISVIEKARIAKAIEEKLNLQSLVLLRGFSKRSSNVYEIYKSFSINNFIFWWLKYINIILVSKILLSTFFIFKKYRTGEELLSMEKHGIVIGDLLYDTLIRFNPKSYTVADISYKKHFRLIFRALYSIELYKKIFEKYDIKAVVTSHNVYAEFGILCRLANQYGVNVYLKDMKVFKLYDQKIHIDEHFLKTSIRQFEEGLSDKSLYNKALDYLKSRLDGTVDQVDVKNAYRDKKIYSKDDLLKYFDLNRENKNVFILAHAFSDGPHVGGGLLFNDYYHWLVEVIKIMSTVKGINVFVKPHPSSYMWNESGAVEDILSQLSIDNIHILPNDFNTNSIKDIADYLLTARGTAGLEFSCFGIPAITAAQGYYSGFGIAHEPKTRKEYEDTLKNILKIETLSEEVKKKAIIILYLSFQNYWHSDVLPRQEILPGDDYDTLYKLQYKELCENLKAGKEMKDSFYNHVYALAK